MPNNKTCMIVLHDLLASAVQLSCLRQAPEAACRAAVEAATAAAEAAHREAAMLRERSEAAVLRCNSLELRVWGCFMTLPLGLPKSGL